MKTEIIVVGAGHAGCEAALASARMHHNTILITGNLNNIATMPCNPSIGGSAKGIIVREIDALGGEMGKNADKTTLQLKMLNVKKGPGVRSLRSQNDKITYPREMVKTLKNQDKLTLLEGMVEDLIIEGHEVKGVVLATGEKIFANAVILTTGTYMKAEILLHNTRVQSGPNNQKPSLFLSNNLEKYGFEIMRLKTGTPPRIKRDTVDYDKLKIEYGDDKIWTFSFENNAYYKVEDQQPCYLVFTNEKVHEIIRNNINKSSAYGALLDFKGVGPRYCPSIEDKIIKFSDKERHQLFLEPESMYYDDMYLQGFSMSMPHEIQEQLVHSLEGLENCIITKYAYAIEYDAINPLQLKNSLETKLVSNLFTAGQINGTSGYEEAACQGIMAGINASLKLESKEPLILKRNEAYIGVLIDDLVTKGTREPYRMLTSRAEYRLLLRHDNADIRLREYGHQIGLVSEENYTKFLTKLLEIEQVKDILRTNKITPSETINNYLIDIESAVIKDGITFYDLLKRPEVDIDNVKNFIDLNYSDEVLDQAVINIKYEGYIVKMNKEASNMVIYEKRLIPTDIDYDKITNLATEAKIKLKQIRPTSIGQATRISGVNPSDVSILMIYLKRCQNEYWNVH